MKIPSEKAYFSACGWSAGNMRDTLPQLGGIKYYGRECISCLGWSQMEKLRQVVVSVSGLQGVRSVNLRLSLADIVPAPAHPII